MLTRYQYLLTKLAEEASEVAQIALKTNQFGPDSCDPRDQVTNTERIHKELIDLLAIVEMLNEEFSFNFATDSEETWYCKLAKKEKVNKYCQYSMNLGMVEHPTGVIGE